MIYGIRRGTDPELAFFDNSEIYPFTVSFSIDGIDGDKSNINELTVLGVPSSITDNEELENYYSIRKKDFPTEQSLHDCLNALGFTYDPNW